MSSIDFYNSKIWDVMVDIEGSEYTIDPNDPGGATKYGISQRAYPGLNIEKITSEDAYQIFQKDYFLKSTGDWWLAQGYPAFSIMISAFAFHAGDKNAIKCLQTVINNYNKTTLLLVDGDLGPKTLAAVEAFDKSQKDIVMIILYPDLLTQILSYYKDLYIFKTDAPGYLNRIIKVLRAFPGNSI